MEDKIDLWLTLSSFSFLKDLIRELLKKKPVLYPIFVQENYSKSTKGVLRSMHYQLPPKAQDKLVYVA